MILRSSAGQAYPEPPIPITKEFFNHTSECKLTWLGSAGVLMNINGLILAVDPVLSGSDMPMFYDYPLKEQDIPHIDAVLITHIDSDHYSKNTCESLKEKTGCFYAPGYTAEEMARDGLPVQPVIITETFLLNTTFGPVKITPTPVDHTWQNHFPDYAYRTWLKEDYCGYRIETDNISIWIPGDSKLMEEHLHQKTPDIILFDCSDDAFHIGFENAVLLANSYPDAKLICYHWGTYIAPDLPPFNPDPEKLIGRIINPERLFILRQGAPFLQFYEIPVSTD